MGLISYFFFLNYAIQLLYYVTENVYIAISPDLLLGKRDLERIGISISAYVMICVRVIVRLGRIYLVLPV